MPSFESPDATQGSQEVEKVRFLMNNAQRVLDGLSRIGDSTYDELSQKLAKGDPEIEPLRHEATELLRQIPVADVRNHFTKAKELISSNPNDAEDWLKGGLQHMHSWKEKGLLSEEEFTALAEEADAIKTSLA